METLFNIGLFLVSFVVGWSLRSWFAYKMSDDYTGEEGEENDFLPNSSFVYRMEEINNVFYAYDLAGSFIMQDTNSTHIHESIKERFPYVEYYLMINEPPTREDESV